MNATGTRRFTAVRINSGNHVHAADPEALADRNPYAVGCGAVRVRGRRTAVYYTVDAEVTCSKCRKEYGLD